MKKVHTIKIVIGDKNVQGDKITAIKVDNKLGEGAWLPVSVIDLRGIQNILGQYGLNLNLE